LSSHTLQDVFELGLDEFCRGRELHPREWRAASAIRYCYTPAMGSHTEGCLAGDYSKQFFHACRHRSCPRCSDAARATWIDAELQRLLPCSHFHVVFTWPHSLLALWERNRAWCTKLLFDCARQSLLELLADPRHLGAVPGLLMSLHTWGRTLSHHPHLHTLVTAGGLDSQQQWLNTKPGWLLPLRPLKQLFRGKLLDALWQALDHQRLDLPAWTNKDSWQQQIKRLYRKHWNLEIRPPYDSGRGVVLYLARYAKGGPLPANRPLRTHSAHVYFDYSDHRDGSTKTLKLQTQEFISRVLWHASPRGVHTTRHAGLYSSSQRELRQLAATELSAAQPIQPWPRPSKAPTASPATRRCPNCHGPLLRLASSPRRIPRSHGMHQRGEISLSAARADRLAPHSTGPPTTSAQRGPTGRSS
jgi:Putative transposase/Transposase zinc-binding domain